MMEPENEQFEKGWIAGWTEYREYILQRLAASFEDQLAWMDCPL